MNKGKRPWMRFDADGWLWLMSQNMCSYCVRASLNWTYNMWSFNIFTLNYKIFSLLADPPGAQYIKNKCRILVLNSKGRTF